VGVAFCKPPTLYGFLLSLVITGEVLNSPVFLWGNLFDKDHHIGEKRLRAQGGETLDGLI